MTPYQLNQWTVALRIDRPPTRISDKATHVWAVHERDGHPQYYRIALNGRFTAFAGPMTPGTWWIITGFVNSVVMTIEGNKRKVVEIVATAQPIAL